jgi:hypothetical protein
MQSVTGLCAEECFRQVKIGQMTATEVRMMLFDGQSEKEAFRFEQLMGNTYTIPMDRVEDLVENWRRNQEDEGLVENLAGLMRHWERDSLSRIREEQERETGAAVRLVARTWNELRQLMRGGRQVEDGDENAHEVDQWTMDSVRRIMNIGCPPSGGMACIGNARCKQIVSAA